MQANVIKRELVQRKNIYEGVTEIGVQSDIVLPDYCGDIERILKCTLVPRLSGKRVESQRLSVSGTGFLRMVYLTAEGKVDSFETQIPFSKNIDMQEGGENIGIKVTLCTDYSNCRAVSPRRFEVHAAIKMKAKVSAGCSTYFAQDIDEKGVEIRKTSIDAIIPIASVCENFTVMEEYELSGAPISSVVRMSANPAVSEYKIISGKIIVKGDVALDIVYLSEDSDRLQSVKYNIPVNHILSANGAEEGDGAEVRLDICRMSAEPTRHGDNNELVVEVLLEACAEVSRKENIEAAIDAYCVGFESNCSRNNTSFTILEQTVNKMHSISITPETDGGEILDVFAEAKNAFSKVNEQGEVMLSADVTAAALCKNQDGEVYMREKTVPIEFSLAADPDFAGADLDGDVSLRSAEISGGKNSVSVSLLGSCTISKNKELPLISEMEILSDSPLAKDPKTAMTIYFADAGEDIFDIAKRYNTSARAVMEQNDLSGSSITSQRTILIPMVR